MEQFLTQCHSLLVTDYPLILAVVAAGLVGSLSHCSTMCSPLVAAQMLELNQRRASQWPMAAYHAGRVATYSALGFLAFAASRFVFSGQLATLSRPLLVLAGLVFLYSTLRPAKTHRCCSGKTKGLLRLINRLRSLTGQYALRGLLMGFMPCGMLLSVLLLAATAPTAPQAAGLMLLFGLTTLPALQAAGYAVLSLGKRHPRMASHLGRGMLALNGLFLCFIGLSGATV